MRTLFRAILRAALADLAAGLCVVPFVPAALMGIRLERIFRVESTLGGRIVAGTLLIVALTPLPAALTAASVVSSTGRAPICALAWLGVLIWTSALVAPLHRAIPHALSGAPVAHVLTLGVHDAERLGARSLIARQSVFLVLTVLSVGTVIAGAALVGALFVGLAGRYAVLPVLVLAVSTLVVAPMTVLWAWRRSLSVHPSAVGARPLDVSTTTLVGTGLAIALAIGVEPPMGRTTTPAIDDRPLATDSHALQVCWHDDGVHVSRRDVSSFASERLVRFPPLSDRTERDEPELGIDALAVTVSRDKGGDVWAVRTNRGGEALFSRDGLRLDDGLSIRWRRRFGWAPGFLLAALLLLVARLRRVGAERELADAASMTLELGEGASVVAAAGELVPRGDVVLRDEERVVRLVEPVEWLGDLDRAPRAGTRLWVHGVDAPALGPRVGARALGAGVWLSDDTALARERLLRTRTVVFEAAAAAVTAMQVVVALALL